VSVITLKPQHHLALPYTVPWNGHMRFEVESEYPTTTLVLDPQNLALWKGGQPYTYQGGFSNLVRHSQDLRLPAGGMWYLVIVNTLGTPMAVHYNVWLG